MQAKIYFNKEARAKMKNGVDQLADAVKATMGPSGRNVIIYGEMPPHNPKITKDGVTVARHITFLDAMEAMGAQIVKQAAVNTAETAGDGTTTSTLLAQVIIDKGLHSLNGEKRWRWTKFPFIYTRYPNPVDIKRGIDKAVSLVVENLRAQARPITKKNLIQIATVAANNEFEIGRLVSEAIEKTGEDGVIYLQNSKTGETFIELTEGIQIDRGYISPYFVNVPAKMIVELDNPLILFSERKISSLKDIQHILEICHKNARPLLIIADDVDGDALTTLVANKHLGFAAIKQPGFGNMQLQMFDDIAVMTGGTIVSEAGKGHAWIKVDHTYLGEAEKVVITQHKTSIIGAKGKKEAIEGRIEEIRALIENCPDEFEKEKLRKVRLAKLVNGVGIIHVGGQTEVEMLEKKDRVDDAVRATKSAIAEGVLPGGGTAYVKALCSLPYSFDNIDENAGLDIIKHALSAPLLQIALNAGLDGATILNNILSSPTEEGFNAKTEMYGNMFQYGIIDPLKVSRVALENAASVGAMFLTTEAAIIPDVPVR